jgi:hypothetical protein
MSEALPNLVLRDWNFSIDVEGIVRARVVE